MKEREEIIKEIKDRIKFFEKKLSEVSGVRSKGKYHTIISELKFILEDLE